MLSHGDALAPAPFTPFELLAPGQVYTPPFPPLAPSEPLFFTPRHGTMRPNPQRSALSLVPMPIPAPMPMSRKVRPNLPQRVLVVIPRHDTAVLLIPGKRVELVVAVVELLVVRGIGTVLIRVQAVLVV